MTEVNQSSGIFIRHHIPIAELVLLTKFIHSSTLPFQILLVQFSMITWGKKKKTIESDRKRGIWIHLKLKNLTYQTWQILIFMLVEIIYTFISYIIFRKIWNKLVLIIARSCASDLFFKKTYQKLAQLLSEIRWITHQKSILSVMPEISQMQ